jgi:hypothetical protein
MRRQLKILIFVNAGLVSLLLFLYQRQTSWEGIHKFVKSSVANYIISVDFSSREKQNSSFIPVQIKHDGAVLPIPIEIGNSTQPVSFVDVARSRMSPNGILILAYFDYPFLDSAFNFYETSLKPFGLTNFVFTVSDWKCCEAMVHLGPGSCFVYRKDAASDTASSYGNADFKRKMNIRTDMILDCLNVGITVLHSDIDVYFTKNPFDFINCPDCDIAPLMDTNDYNAGFLYIRPTANSIRVYERMKQIAIASPHVDDQDQLTQAIGEMKSKQPDFKVTELNTEQFQCGLYYYENGHHTFAGDNPCVNCVVVHNNWIVSMEAKEYRCKETGMWNYDGDGYYSSTERKYLVYSNPIIMGNKDVIQSEELKALISAFAIARVLNRTLILPALHCDQRLCSMLDFYRISHLDKQFKGLYRESVFLRHPKVPDSILKSKSPLYFIASARATEIVAKFSQDELGSNVKQLGPKNQTNGATSEEILEWFGKEPSSILQMHSLYHAFYKFTNETAQADFESKISKGLTRAGYRQF